MDRRLPGSDPRARAVPTPAELRALANPRPPLEVGPFWTLPQLVALAAIVGGALGMGTAVAVESTWAFVASFGAAAVGVLAFVWAVVK